MMGSGLKTRSTLSRQIICWLTIAVMPYSIEHSSASATCTDVNTHSLLLRSAAALHAAEWLLSRNESNAVRSNMQGACVEARRLRGSKMQATSRGFLAVAAW